jgi:hypothetical protein
MRNEKLEKEEFTRRHKGTKEEVGKRRKRHAFVL